MRTTIAKTEALSPRSRFEAPAPSDSTPGEEVLAPRKRRGRGRGVLAVVMTAVCLAAGVALWKARSSAAPAYVTAPVERGTVTHAVSASGMVNPVETVQVGSYVSGRIQDLSCDYNTKVAKGQVCAKIDPRSYQASVAQAAASVATAKAQSAKDEASFEYRKQLYARRLSLSERGVMSQEATDEARSAYRQLQAQLQLDAAAIAQHEAELQAARVNLDYTDIVSPVEGTVVSRNVTVGQTVAASFQTPTLFLIARDLTQMQVDVNVSEADIGDIRVGEKASFTVEAFPDHRFTGTVTQVRQAPISVQNVISYDVVIQVANPELLLKPGMTATAHIVLAEHENVPRLPQQALRFTPPGGSLPDARAAAAAPSEHGVWVLRDGRLERVPVTLGLTNDTFVEVTAAGLHPGDQVVVGEHAAGEPAPAAGGES